MCGRFALVATREEFATQFHLGRQVTVAPRYNIAPSQQIIIIRSRVYGSLPKAFRWGLIPSWSTDLKAGNTLINARAETVKKKSVFRKAFDARRCLVPATGFYEWLRQEGGRKQPYFIQMRSGRLFAFAGIWDTWQSPEGESIDSCAIITTKANSIVGKIHDRMPVIIPETAYDLWLDSWEEGNFFDHYLAPYPPANMEAYPVGSRVNDARNEGEDCIRRVD